ncbi:MAG: hypothetical protein COA47_14560 [Robiginitomaculum sp.]|nr:MAG: hypothetical protein COA47_14560 [Robiginitomaculum sp.]
MVMDFVNDAIAKAGIKMFSEPMEDGQLRCRLENERCHVTREVSVAAGREDEFWAGSLLYHLMLNAQQFAACDDFADWLDETGCKLPKDEARAKYEQLEKDQKSLEFILGPALYPEVMAQLEISQAISNARPGR